MFYLAKLGIKRKLTNFGYRINMKIKMLSNPFIFWKFGNAP